jgi:hypothetical protein
MTRYRLVAAVAASALVLSGCSTYPWDGHPARYLPPTDVAFDYQLGGAYDPEAGVRIVARDSTDEPVEGVYNICYVNGFQTQPGRTSFWLNHHPRLVLRDAEGQPVADPEWPDEYLLDTSSYDNRRDITDILIRVMSGCSSAGFDAVEFDNLDSWTRSDGALTFEHNVALARMLVFAAHGIGLTAAQKNGAGSSARLRDEVGFDFAITEECARYEECEDYTDAYGDLVFDIEYSAEFLPDACAAVGAALLRDRALATPDDPEYVFESC